MASIPSRSHQSEAAGEVSTEHARLEGLNVSADVSLLVEHVPVFGQLVQYGFLLVRKHNACMECTNHQQGLTESA